MTFISVNKTSLQSALSLANQVSPKKSDIEIFTFTRCEIKRENLVLSALQSHAYYNVSVKLDKNDTTEDVVFLIKTDLFASTVATMNDDVISLELDMAKRTIILQGAKSKHTLRIDTDRIGDFTVPEEKPDELVVKFKVKTAQLIEADKVAFTTVGQPKTMYQHEFLSLCYTVVTAADQLKVVSCDKFRISKTSVDIEVEHSSPDFVEESRNFLIQPKGITLLHSCLGDEEEVSLNFEKSMIWVHMENSTLVLRYGEGVYPDYEKIIPQTFTCHIAANTDDIRQALKQVYLTARTNAINKSLVMKLDPTGKKMIFSSQSDDGFSSESVVDIATYEGVNDEWSQSFNADYLIDYVNHIETENVVFDANPGKPMVLSPEGQKSRQICMVQGLR